MSNNDSFAYGQRGALPISNNISPGDLDQEPESGEQYMLRVMMEAAAAPKIAVAINREHLISQTTLSMRSSNRQSECSKDASELESPPLLDVVLSTEKWRQNFRKYFMQQRSKFNRMIASVDVPNDFALPGSGNSREWKTFCYETSGNSPTNRAMLHALAAMDQVMALRLIKWISAWLAADKLWRAESIWLWYLILKLDSLLDQEDIHMLRELCRKLKRVRVAVGHVTQNDLSGQIQSRSDEIAALNILIAAVTRGYRQHDLE
ncbi:gem (nuclear organelle) associated protein 2 [Kickxella alabastrina]|uniref:Gem (Nuclear organelle) associated protein 2 n=1 Tax=Kickxella alabastrina TaxID=61397 RepID=A0ACC1IEV9_9FUNG|nr:gem (nuclear organelle) associated protein 2 [Kickxella alabastrina]